MTRTAVPTTAAAVPRRDPCRARPVPAAGTAARVTGNP